MIQTACKTKVPVEAFIASLPKRASCCIGICSTQEPKHNPCLTQVSIEISRAWSLHKQRASCVITAGGAFEAPQQQDDLPCETSLRSWSWLGQSDFPTDGYSGPIARDVSGLTKLKSEHGLILIELGSVESLRAQFASKLCDGLVLLTSSSSSTNFCKKIRSRIRLLERPDCRWLGYWYLESDPQIAQA
jgi:hypothetical protein